jgi:hypothetical protein
MRKFALYYGVLRSNGNLVNLGLGTRGDINGFKDQCKKDVDDPKVCSKYSSLVLATDYGLKNHYKLTLPDAPKAKTKKEDK